MDPLAQPPRGASVDQMDKVETSRWYTELWKWAKTAASDLTTVIADLAAHLADTTAHGATGANMGTTNSQVVSNKTFDNSNKYGGASNYSMFETDGTYVAMGNATTWDDLRVEPVVRYTGATTNNPAFNQYRTTGVRVYEFDDAGAATEKEVHFQAQLPHAWAGTTIYPHIHIIPLGATGGAREDIDWEFEYAWADIGADMPAPTAATTTVNPQSATTTFPTEATTWVQYKHYVNILPAITPSTSQDGISSILICKLRRKSGNGTDTYNGKSVALLYIDLHYEVNTLGSRTEFSK